MKKNMLVILFAIGVIALFLCSCSVSNSLETLPEKMSEETLDTVLETQKIVLETAIEESMPTVKNEQNSEMLVDEETTASIMSLEIVEDDGIYSYSKMEQDLNDFASMFPSIVSLYSIGETMDGRQIYCLRIGSDVAIHKVLVTASIHGREYITSELLMQQVKNYLNNISLDKEYKGIPYSEMLANTTFYILPMVNPDGVAISQFGLEGLQKDTTKETVRNIAKIDGATDLNRYYKRWKSNAEGVDINRQFDALWEQYNDNVGHPSSDHYKGISVGSTVEARALIDITNKEQFERTISYHTAGQVIYWYFGQTGDLYDETKSFADRISATTGYPLDSNYQNLDPAGYKDWAISKKNIPSITIEVGKGESPIDSSQIDGIYLKNKSVFEETVLSIQIRDDILPLG